MVAKFDGLIQGIVEFPQIQPPRLWGALSLMTTEEVFCIFRRSRAPKTMSEETSTRLMTLGCQNVDALPKKGATGGRDIFLKRRIGDRSTGSGVEADGSRSHTDAGDYGPI